MKKIDEQVTAIEALDQKVGILLGFLGAISAGLLAVIFAATPHSLAAVGTIGRALLFAVVFFIGVAIYFAFRAFLMAPYFGLPKFSDLFSRVQEEEKQIRNEFLPTLLKATNENIKTLTNKQKHSQRAGWAVLLSFLILLIAIIAVGWRIFQRS